MCIVVNVIMLDTAGLELRIPNEGGSWSSHLVQCDDEYSARMQGLWSSVDLRGLCIGAACGAALHNA